MTDQDAVRDDIAFMRALAEQGRQGPLIGGAIMVAGGLLFGGASLVIWIGLLAGASANSAIQLAWPAAGLLFFGALFWLLRRSPLPSSGAARGVGIAWSATGWTMFVMGVCLVVMALRLHDGRFSAAFSPIILSLYGSSWLIAAAAGPRWLYGVAVGAFAMAIVTAWFALQPINYLIYAVSLFALVAAPGFVLTREARDATA